MNKIFVTGTAGFIGFMAKLLLAEGYSVHGLMGWQNITMLNWNNRHEILSQNEAFGYTISMLEEKQYLDSALDEFQPDVLSLAAQAGVRYSIENPKAYIDANILGTFNILEA